MENTNNEFYDETKDKSLYVDLEKFYNRKTRVIGRNKKAKEIIEKLLVANISKEKIAEYLKISLDELNEILDTGDNGYELIKYKRENLYNITDGGLLCYNLKDFHDLEAYEIGTDEEEKRIIELLIEAGITKQDICKYLDLSLDRMNKILDENSD